MLRVDTNLRRVIMIIIPSLAFVTQSTIFEHRDAVDGKSDGA